LRIAQLCPYDIDRPGGVQKHILDLSHSLARSGHEVTVIAPRISGAGHKANPPNGNDPLSIVHVGRGRLISLNKTAFEISLATGKERKRLGQLLHSAAFDVLHLHTPLSPFLPLQALFSSKAANIATFHAVPPETASGPVQRYLYSALNRWIIAKLDGAVLASAVQRDLHLEGTVVAPCISLRRFGADVPPLDGYGDNRVNILFVGRLEPRKGAAILLEAYRDLCRQDLPVRLLIAGDGPERDALSQVVASHNIPNVTFFGRVEDDYLPRLYATCDIFCAPSIYGEGFGIVLVEAMASGKPVVAAANEGYRTVLHGEAEQFLVEPGNVIDLSAKLRLLVTEPARRKSLADWGRRNAPRYDSDCLVSTFLSLYKQAILSRDRKADLRGEARKPDVKAN
jgi:phosphatidyl-myo-inositol alpha-mannosyltransferase